MTVVKRRMRVEAYSLRFEGLTREHGIRLSGSARIGDDYVQEFTIVVSRYLARELAKGCDEIDRRTDLAISRLGSNGRFVKVRRKPQLRVVPPS